MIGTLIVLCTLALAAIFAAAWWLLPGLRRAIEAPKHGFAARVRQYDETRRPPVGPRASQDGA
jgi:hypothetical protein